MELWIRSQNKEKLVKVNELSLYDRNVLNNSFVLNDNPDYSDISIIANDNYNLGTYKTKERALEVLDEIQKKLNARKGSECSVEYILIDNIAPVIYEMPKE